MARVISFSGKNRNAIFAPLHWVRVGPSDEFVLIQISLMPVDRTRPA